MMSQRRMHDLVMKNISTLAEYTGRKVTPANISKYMGIGPTADLYEYWVNSRTITSLRSIAMISEFYGVPEEIILFKDIRAIYDKQQFEESYADIVRSHRR
jgi:transcriptional regulator with XRE-family HTH domain